MVPTAPWHNPWHSAQYTASLPYLRSKVHGSAGTSLSGSTNIRKVQQWVMWGKPSGHYIPDVLPRHGPETLQKQGTIVWH